MAMSLPLVPPVVSLRLRDGKTEEPAFTGRHTAACREPDRQVNLEEPKQSRAQEGWRRRVRGHSYTRYSLFCYINSYKFVTPFESYEFINLLGSLSGDPCGPA